VGVLEGTFVAVAVFVAVGIFVAVEVFVDVGIFVAVEVFVGGTLVAVFGFYIFLVGPSVILCPFPVGGAPANTLIGVTLTIMNEIPTTIRDNNEIFRMFIPTLLYNRVYISM
jgi:hypothetical protein